MPLEVIAGRYRVERAVGQGGMGTVWLCRDEILHRPVAIKQIGALPGDSADHARRAMREARTAAALHHEKAVSIYDVVEHDGAPWLVMEYVPSRTLAETMADGPLPPRRVARIGAQVAAALASAHALGIVHRDVKPGNILVGEEDSAKISDFGIARIMHDERLTQTGLMTGTPGYFSPELARGADAGPESDVWALGATLYAAVEGRPPYPKHTNPLATLQAIASEPAPPPTRAGILLAPITHMMDRDPNARWTMARAETELRRLAGQTPTPPGGEPTPVLPTPVQRAPGWRRTPEPESAGPESAGPEPAQPESAQPESAQLEPDVREPLPFRTTATPSEPRFGPPAEHRSRAFPVALVLAALLLVGIGGYLMVAALSSRDSTAGSAGSAADGPSRSPRQRQTTPAQTPSGTGVQTPGESVAQTPGGSVAQTPGVTAGETAEETSGETSGETGHETPQAPPVGAAAAKIGAIESYFNTVPEDLNAGFAQLSPRYRRQVGRDSYVGFWSTIRDVAVSNARVSGNAVLATITYTRQDGSVAVEEHRLPLVRSGSRYLIDGDEPVG